MTLMKFLNLIKMRNLLFRILVIITAVAAVETSQDDTDGEYRSKRQLNSLPLVYPYGGTYRFHYGFTMPVPTEDKVSLAFAASFLYQYVQNQNITQISQYYPINRIARDQGSRDWENRADERLVFYKAAEGMLSAKGFSGQDCVLRAICEAAQYSVKDEGLVGEIMHILLTPNYGRSSFDEDYESWRQSMSEYVSAYEAGRQMFGCSYIYSSCPEGEGILEIVTLLRDE